MVSVRQHLRRDPVRRTAHHRDSQDRRAGAGRAAADRTASSRRRLEGAAAFPQDRLVPVPHPYQTESAAPDRVMAALEEAHRRERAAAAEHRRALADHHHVYAQGGGMARARRALAATTTAGQQPGRSEQATTSLALHQHRLARAHRALSSARLHLAVARTGHGRALERRRALLGQMESRQQTDDRARVDQAQAAYERLPDARSSASATAAQADLRTAALTHDALLAHQQAHETQSRADQLQTQANGAHAALGRRAAALPPLRPGLWSADCPPALARLSGPLPAGDDHREAWETFLQALCARLPGESTAHAGRFLERARASWRLTCAGAAGSALALQLACADLFDLPALAVATLPGAPHPDQPTLSVPAHTVGAREGYAEHAASAQAYDHAAAALDDPRTGTLWRALCALLHERAQDSLGEAGIGAVTLYRPLVFPTREGTPYDVRRALLLGQAELHLHPLTSWTADLRVALSRVPTSAEGEEAGEGGLLTGAQGAYGVLLAARVDAASILALGGAGLLPDATAHEVILLAGRGTVAIKEARALAPLLDPAP